MRCSCRPAVACVPPGGTSTRVVVSMRIAGCPHGYRNPALAVCTAMSRPSTVACCQENVGHEPATDNVPPNELRSRYAAVGGSCGGALSAMIRSRRSRFSGGAMSPSSSVPTGTRRSPPAAATRRCQRPTEPPVPSSGTASGTPVRAPPEPAGSGRSRSRQGSSTSASTTEAPTASPRMPSTVNGAARIAAIR